MAEQAEVDMSLEIAKGIHSLLVNHQQVMNELGMSRTDYIREQECERDLAELCHYKGEPCIEDFERLIRTDPISARVLNILPKECWKIPPQIFETEDLSVSSKKQATLFERDFAMLPRFMNNGIESHYRDEKSYAIVEKMMQLDIVSGVGRYGLMFIGFADGVQDLSQPVKPKQGMKVHYLRNFRQSQITIVEREKSPLNPRYCQPTVYELSLTNVDSDTDTDMNRIGAKTTTIKVHWTRVIHCPSDSEITDTADIEADERLRVHYYNLMDLQKLYRGSAEMYWKGAFMGISLETHPNLGANVTLPVEALKKMVDEYQAGLRRHLALGGMSAKNLSPQVVDPNKQIEVQLMAITIRLGCPKRKFMGSEMGHLASTQDEGEWDDIVRSRQNERCIPRIVVPLTDRLIHAGVLSKPDPANGWRCVWPALDYLSADDIASIGLKRTQALKDYVVAGADVAIPLKHWLISCMGLDEKEAQAIVDANKVNSTDDSMDGVIGGKLFGTVGGVYGITELFDKLQTGAYDIDTLAQLLALFYKIPVDQAKLIIGRGPTIMQMGPEVTGKSKVDAAGNPIKGSPNNGTNAPRQSQFSGSGGGQ